MGAALTPREPQSTARSLSTVDHCRTSSSNPLTSTASGAAAVTVRPQGDYALAATLGCGQTFRFRQTDSGFLGACGDLVMRINPHKEWLSIRFVADGGDISRVTDFLDLAHDVREPAHESLLFLCSRFPQHARRLRSVFAYSRGVHLLRQPILETLIGYLFSVQSTVGLVGRRLETLARLFPSNCRTVAGTALYTFPSVEQLRTLTEDAVAGLRLGYRSTWFLEMLKSLPDEVTLQALGELCPGERQDYFRQFAGVGPKVAACIDLFAYGNDRAFPIDVWVERGLRHVLGMSPAEIKALRRNPADILGPHCGLFGEYLFRYERDMNGVEGAPPVTGDELTLARRSSDTSC